VKRSDLATSEVLAAVRDHRFRAFEYLADRYPAKVVAAAFSRDVRAGLLEYGVSLVRPWLEPAGERLLAAGGGPGGGERTSAEGPGEAAAP
jgi:hypothetical protein